VKEVLNDYSLNLKIKDVKSKCMRQAESSKSLKAPSPWNSLRLAEPVLSEVIHRLLDVRVFPQLSRKPQRTHHL
jgi:hypothetical protein